MSNVSNNTNEFNISVELKNKDENLEGKSFAVGFDVGGTSVKCGIVDLENKKIVVSGKYNTRSKTFVDDGYDALNKMLEISGIDSNQIIGYGFGVPGKLDDERNTIIKLPNILDENGNCIVDYPLRDKIESVFGTSKSIFINNDVEAALISEVALNEDIDSSKDCIMLAMGTGLGGAVKRVGESSLNVEPGHDEFFDYITGKMIEENARYCKCGGYAHIEPYCNIEAVKKDYEEALGDKIPEDIRCQSDIVARIFNVAVLNRKDSYIDREVAIIAVSSFLTHLKKAIILEMIKHKTNKVILGGGISEGVKYFIPRLEDMIREFFLEHDEYDIDVSEISIIQAKSKNDAGVLGNALSAYQEYLLQDSYVKELN